MTESAPERSRRAAVAGEAQALEQFAIGAILVNRLGDILHRNRIAEQFLATGDGLTPKQGRLTAHRTSDAARLKAAIAAATASDNRHPRHLLVGRGSGRPSYALAVSAFRQGAALFGAPTALVTVVDPELYVPSDEALAECFGLSPAESRLASFLMAGHSLRQIAGGFDLEITTVRTQLASILRKVGVGRQPALVRALSSIGFIAARSPGPSPHGDAA